MIDILGYTGGVLLAFCALPQAIMCVKTKTAKGLSWGLLSMWMGGEVFTLIYILNKIGLDLPLVLNYIMNILILGVIFKYKIGDTNV